MRFLCARQAWHDAFMTDTAAPDFATQAANAGLQRTARGADSKIIDHCERGYIQHAIAVLRESDYTAYCWGMIAYAPQGTATMGEFAAMHGWLRTKFFERLAPGSEMAKNRYNPEFERLLKTLAKIAVIDAGAEDARQGQEKELLKVHRRLTSDLAEAAGVRHMEYMAKWHKWYKFFKRTCGDELPKRALGVVAQEVNKRREAESFTLVFGIGTDTAPAPTDDLTAALAEALAVAESVGAAKAAARRIIGTLALRK